MRRPSLPTVISLIALFVALGGTSYLRRLVTKVSGLPDADETLAVLQPGYRPSARLVFAAASGGTSVGNGYGRVDVAPTGNVTWWPGVSAEVDITGLDDIGFPSD